MPLYRRKQVTKNPFNKKLKEIFYLIIKLTKNRTFFK